MVQIKLHKKLKMEIKLINYLLLAYRMRYGDLAEERERQRDRERMESGERWSLGESRETEREREWQRNGERLESGERS
jgi:hypothetical protein